MFGTDCPAEDNKKTVANAILGYSSNKLYERIALLGIPLGWNGHPRGDDRDFRACQKT